MNRKAIKGVLRRKLQDWISSIEDPAVKAAIEKDAFVTGGAIASFLLGEKVNDYDIYFRTRETTRLVACYYVGKWKGFHPIDEREIVVNTEKDDRISIMVSSDGAATENGIQDDILEPAENQFNTPTQDERQEERDTEELPKYRPVFLSSNAITLSNSIQLITRFYGEPDEIHANYDFVHCTNYWLYREGHLELRPAALESLLTKQLRYVGSKYPLCSLMRIRKFISRDWFINAGDMLKAIWQVHELDLSDLEVLKEQLTGVDTYYFSVMINALRKKEDHFKEHPEQVQPYVFELIDRLF